VDEIDLDLALALEVLYALINIFCPTCICSHFLSQESYTRVAFGIQPVRYKRQTFNTHTRHCGIHLPTGRV